MGLYFIIMKQDLKEYEKGDIIAVHSWGLRLGILESIEKPHNFHLRFLELGHNNLLWDDYLSYIWSYNEPTLKDRVIYTGRNVFKDPCLPDDQLEIVHKIFSKYHPKRKDQILKTTHYDKARTLRDSGSSENIDIFSSI